MLTDDEVALYDRQLRLWGVEAQKRLNNAKILIIGMSGLGAEVAKNIILGGVKSVTLMDNKNVTEQDASSQFLVSRDSIGQNRAGASLARAQLLNPMVDVMASSANMDEKKDQFFAEFTVICATGCTKTQIGRLDRIAREHGIKFFASSAFGFTSFIFSDLGKVHSFTREIVTQATKDHPESSRVVAGSVQFGPFQDILDINWNSASERMLKKTDAWVHTILVLLEFVEKFKRQPSPSSRNPDFQELVKIRDNYMEKHGLDYERLDDSLFANVYGQLGPVCAVTGGVLAQEIVKAVSHKDEPISNLFIYNPVLGTGIVERFSRRDTPVLYQEEMLA